MQLIGSLFSPRGTLSNLEIKSDVYMELGISVLTCSPLLFITTEVTNALCALFLTNEETGVQRLTEWLFQMNGDQPKQLI